MKKMRLYLLMFLLLLAGISFAQEQGHNIPRQIFTTVDEMPEFPGGRPAMGKFMAKHLRYPRSAVSGNVEGKVVVRFIVETDGSLSDITIQESVNPDCDAETLRVVGKMPRWNAGRHQGAAAACYYSLPVTFSLR